MTDDRFWIQSSSLPTILSLVFQVIKNYDFLLFLLESQTENDNADLLFRMYQPVVPKPGSLGAHPAFVGCAPFCSESISHFGNTGVEGCNPSQNQIAGESNVITSQWNQAAEFKFIMKTLNFNLPWMHHIAVAPRTVLIFQNFINFFSIVTKCPRGHGLNIKNSPPLEDCVKGRTLGLEKKYLYVYLS